MSLDVSGKLGEAHYCYYKDQMCYWQIYTKLSCDPGSSYPALATSREAAHVTLVCEGKAGGERYSYFFKPFDSIDTLIKNGNILGVAMVSQDDSFNVYRFDLTGATKALNESEAAFHRKLPTKDQRL